MQFALQGTDDPSLYVPAAAIWTGDATSVADAEETLLAGLGRALRLYPQIAEALRVATPTSMATDADGAFPFLREAAPLLSAAGFGVQLPQWAGRARLGMKLTTRTKTTESGAPSPPGSASADLVDFRWDLAIEGEDLTEEELAELARLKAPLVRLRGRWVELDDAQLTAALEFLSRGREGEMTAAQAVRAAIHAGDDTLPLLEVDADGALGDLLSRRGRPPPGADRDAGELRGHPAPVPGTRPGLAVLLGRFGPRRGPCRRHGAWKVPCPRNTRFYQRCARQSQGSLGAFRRPGRIRRRGRMGEAHGDVDHELRRAHRPRDHDRDLTPLPPACPRTTP